MYTGWMYLLSSCLLVLSYSASFLEAQDIFWLGSYATCREKVEFDVSYNFIYVLTLDLDFRAWRIFLGAQSVFTLVFPRMHI